MDDLISITWLNDFIFCPVSIYYHNLYGTPDSISFQEKSQINGASVHERIDSGKYSTKSAIISGATVYSNRYNLIGKIDILDTKHGILTERKKKIKVIYDGYVLQLYGQYFALKESGYTVNHLFLYSMDDNKKYAVHLPEEDPQMMHRFETVIDQLQHLDLDSFIQQDVEKCRHCIYEPLCDRSLKE